MPPKTQFSRQQVLTAALDITRSQGISALTARALAARLGCSVQPIFRQFQSMDEVQLAVLDSANALYQSYINEDMVKCEYPPYKASGMAYIRFAREEKELFKLLFMRDRTGEAISENREEIRPILDILTGKLGLSEDDAYRFHLELWLYVHGIATMIATNYLNWDMEFISLALTDAYEGLKHRYTV